MVKKVRWALGKGWDNTDKENKIRLEGEGKGWYWKSNTMSLHLERENKVGSR